MHRYIGISVYQYYRYIGISVYIFISVYRYIGISVYQYISVYRYTGISVYRVYGPDIPEIVYKYCMRSSRDRLGFMSRFWLFYVHQTVAISLIFLVQDHLKLAKVPKNVFFHNFCYQSRVFKFGKSVSLSQMWKSCKSTAVNVNLAISPQHQAGDCQRSSVRE